MPDVVKAQVFRHKLLKNYPGGFSIDGVVGCAEELGISKEDLLKIIADFVSKEKMRWVTGEDGVDYLVEARATDAKT